jgi:hypothetical protein
MRALAAVFDPAKHLRPEPPFDIIISLFSSVACLTSKDELTTVIADMAGLLCAGGILLIEPWVRPDAYPAMPIITYSVDKPDLKVARMCIPQREENVTLLDMHHLVARPDGIEYYMEAHRLYMFTDGDFIDAFQAADLVGRFDPSGFDTVGRGMWIATKPSPAPR